MMLLVTGGHKTPKAINATSRPCQRAPGLSGVWTWLTSSTRQHAKRMMLSVRVPAAQPGRAPPTFRNHRWHKVESQHLNVGVWRMTVGVCGACAGCCEVLWALLYAIPPDTISFNFNMCIMIMACDWGNKLCNKTLTTSPRQQNADNLPERDTSLEAHQTRHPRGPTSEKAGRKGKGAAMPVLSVKM